MKHTALFATVLICIVGCERAGHVESTSLSPPSAVDSSTIDAVSDSGIATDASIKMVFNLSDAATNKIRAAIASVPGATHLVVFVDVDDKKYCVGFHYNLDIVADPSKSRFVLLESNGIKLAVEKDDVKFLNGTTLDYAVLASGAEGFVFRNPNENVSLPQELREKQ
jgi:iron-sulfur cluster assembly accessory protein